MTQPFIAYTLAEDVHCFPRASLPLELERALGSATGEFVLTRLGSRHRSLLLPGQSAKLIEQFHSPCSLAEAALRLGTAEGLSSEKVLEEAFPLLRELVEIGWLVEHSSIDKEAKMRPLSPHAELSSEIQGYKPLRRLQALEDTEVYYCEDAGGRKAALKILAPEAPQDIVQTLHREGAILSKLLGSAAPRLLSEGMLQQRSFLLMEWVDGEDCQVVAKRLRDLPPPHSRKGLLTLLLGIARAYAELHHQGVLHGDIHPRNLLIDADLNARILDYGYARVSASDKPLLNNPPRGTIAFFRDPAYAEARLKEQKPPAQTEINEQYSLGALLYLLAAGEHYASFSLERVAQLKEVVGTSPRSFAQLGRSPWPSLEAVLRKALDKVPDKRFGSLEELCAALEKVSLYDGDSKVPQGDNKAKSALQKLSSLLPSVLPLGTPCASLNFGAAGVAYALYRGSIWLQDPALLAQADIWSSFATSLQDDQQGWFQESWGLSPTLTSPHSVFHRPIGAFYVASLIASARHDQVGLRRAVSAFLGELAQDSPVKDFTLGTAGALAAACDLFMLLPSDPEISAQMKRLADEELTIIQRKLQPGDFLGVAHGRAGQLLALLRYYHSMEEAPPPALHEALAELLNCRIKGSKAPLWPRKFGREAQGADQSWCNGSAGYVWLWLLADRFYPGSGFREIAEDIGHSLWNPESTAPGMIKVRSLCCGAAGAAQALLALYQATGKAHWLEGARKISLALNPAESSLDGNDLSLLKGELGVLLVHISVENPGLPTFPLLATE